MNKPIVFCCVLFMLLGLLTGCAEHSPNSPFPDPYVFSKGHTEIVFTDIPASCEILILNLDGDVVRTILENDGDGQASWDVKNKAGEDLTAGIYLYIIKSSEGERKGKLIVSK